MRGTREIQYGVGGGGNGGIVGLGKKLGDPLKIHYKGV